MTNKTYTDNQGNKYRRAGGGWEVMRKGIGWQAFESAAYMTVISEDGAMQTIPPVEKTEPPEVADEKQLRKAREDELFVRLASAAMPTIMGFAENDENEENLEGMDAVEWVAFGCCEQAQAMIDELKERGKI